MLRIFLLASVSCLLFAASPRNFNAEYQAAHSLYSIAKELDDWVRLAGNQFSATRAAIVSLRNSTYVGVIDNILESGDRTRLYGRCAMKWYGNIVDEEYDNLVTAFDSDYQNSNSTDKTTYRWMVNRVGNANTALQRAVTARGRSVDCSTCYRDGVFDGRDC